MLLIMAHVTFASTSNFKLRKPLICVSSQTRTNTTTTPSFIKSSKPPNIINSNCTTFIKCLTPKNRTYTPIFCKYVDSSDIHNAKTSSDTRLKSTPNPVPEPEPEQESWWSDVEVKRKWSSIDLELASVFCAVHILALFGPFTFSWGAFWVSIGLLVVSGMFGLSLSYHRHLTHKSFKLPKWLEYLCAYCGVFALQKDPIYWVSIHRYHHQFTDSKKDPHSPLQGFWYSHINWMFDHKANMEKWGKSSNVRDLESQPFYRFIKSTYYLHQILLGVLLYAFGGFPYLVWGMGVRVATTYHGTWAVNSVCHIWGNRAWNSGDLSKNNWFVALLTFGEGWHNNHHAFEYSARHGLEWWQIDMTWYTLSLLQLVGLVTDVKLPTEEHKQLLAYKSKTNSLK